MTRRRKPAGHAKKARGGRRPWGVRYDYGNGPTTRRFASESEAHRFYVGLANSAEPPLAQSILKERPAR
jgi:hypothetical protein